MRNVLLALLLTGCVAPTMPKAEAPKAQPCLSAQPPVLKQKIQVLDQKDMDEGTVALLVEKASLFGFFGWVKELSDWSKAAWEKCSK